MPYRLVTFLLCFAISSSLLAKPFLLVSLPDEKHLAVYDINSRTGELTHLRNHKTEANPGPMSVSQDGSTLFLSLRTVGRLVSYGIQSGTSELEHISTIEVDQDPAYHWQDHSGQWLITAYYHTGRVSVHHVDSTGHLNEKSSFFGETALNAHGVAATNDNRFVYIPHTGPNKIFSLSLMPRTPSHLARKWGPDIERFTGPRHLASHPTKLGSTGTMNSNKAVFYKIRPDGLLQTIQTISSVPDDWPDRQGNRSNDAFQRWGFHVCGKPGPQ